MFQKYKYVLAVYEEGSFTKAAKRLFISQPSLSVAIRNIEKQLGAPLFERCGSVIKPTESGRAYIAAAQKMRSAENEFEHKLVEINGLQTGRLVVGGSNYMSCDVLPQIISRFRAKHPGVEIILTEANSEHLRQMLYNEDVDVVIDNFEGYTDEFEAYELTNEKIMLCVPAGSQVNTGLDEFRIKPQSLYGGKENIESIQSVDISLFKNEQYILLKSGNDMLNRATAIFESSGIVPNVVFSVDQLNISFSLAELGLGACFVTDTLFKYRKHTSDVVLYKLNHQSATRTLHVAYKKGRYCTRAMAEFTKLSKLMLG